jgi:hypothetical protein
MARVVTEMLLLYDVESEMDYTRGLGQPDTFEFNWLWSHVFEQAETFTEQYGH